MDSVLQQLSEWFKSMLISGIMDNMSSTFNTLNQKMGEVTTAVGQTPDQFQPTVFNLVRNLSENVVMPIAGIILTFIACYELIQLVISHNNLANFESWIFFKWVFKTFLAVTLITNTFNITMAVFDVASHVVSQSGALISGSTAIDSSTLATMQSTLEAMEVGSLFGILLQTVILKVLFSIMALLIYAIVYGRMIEIYLMVSLAPIPFATFGNREQSMIGQNYIRSLFALAFQGFLIMVCVAIYAALVQSVTFSSDVVGSLWNVLGITVLLGFTLFKTGAIAKSVFHAH
ncbi:VirB6/TrbL-like conjugal transfer protein, CD1112 family [Butyrivibrio sp. INlla14]|uniref:VirB6/TrbL-like conjugal transfer protein, CD1112 family n=1 Tax=Butyrivibrio sp. INlla14 TaxID=1520808 RepID=UPI000B87DD55|nr:CD0415/CD1112 family protein [Butyrivibrio sp. INlla14]